MASSISPISSLNTAADTSATSSNSAMAGANVNTFLQLLVAQIKNQNPLEPTDGTQFVAQLAQFSQLEQMIGVRSGVDAMRADLEKALATP